MVESNTAALEGLELSAGDWSARSAGSDLFDVEWRGTQVAQRIYFAVRDAPWNTIPAQILSRTVHEAADSFEVRVRQRHRYDSIDVTVDIAAECSVDGSLRIHTEARCESDFRYSKIGLNIHHGLDAYRGAGYRAETETGQVVGTLGDAIVPQLIRDGSLTAMFEHFDRIEFDLGSIQADFRFEGDRFEMQDHRNWIDANWKTYGTPLEYGFPMDATAGETLSQTVVLRCSGQNPDPSHHPVHGAHRRATVSIGEPVGPLPLIGTRLGAEPPDDPALEAVAAVSPDFVRIDLDPIEVDEDPNRRAELEAQLGFAAQHDLPVELALFTRPDRADLDAGVVVPLLNQAGVRVSRLVVLQASSGFSAFNGAAPTELVAATITAFTESGLVTDYFAGTAQFYNVINRDRPAYPDGVGLTFAANPQVHACDDVSVIQNGRSLGEVVTDCKRHYPQSGVSVSPLELIADGGPYPSGPPEAGARPQDDPRYETSFAGAWLVAALDSAATAGATSVTVFDALGPRGLVSSAAAWHPSAAIAAALCRRTGEPARAVDATGGVSAIAVGQSHPTVVVANTTDRFVRVGVRGIGNDATIRIVHDDESAAQATDATWTAGKGRVEVGLAAYDVAIFEYNDNNPRRGPTR